MKKLSNEELIFHVIVNGFCGERKVELLSKLNERDKLEKALRDSETNCRKVKEEAENLRCCGNCEHSLEKETLVCLKDGKSVCFYNICDEGWELFNLTLEERKI